MMEHSGFILLGQDSHFHWEHDRKDTVSSNHPIFTTLHSLAVFYSIAKIRTFMMVEI